MKRKLMKLTKWMLVCTCLLTTSSCVANSRSQREIDEIVNHAVQPIMQEYRIPGMAIAVTVDGQRHFYNYGVASKETQQPVTSETLFEIGSLSKTFTATLAAYAEDNGSLSFSDNASQYLPALQGSAFDNISLLNLATHTSGGLPLQFPDNVVEEGQCMAYFKDWKPAYKAGTYRSYSNPSIGMLGVIAANSMKEPFEDAVQKYLFSALEMTNSYYVVSADRMKTYAQGYNKQDEPVRLSEGVLSSEAYGVKSGAFDLIRFIEANMGMIPIDGKLQRAIDNTHMGYYQAGEMTQGLVWEQYRYPAKLEQLLAGNSTAMVLTDTVVAEILPPLPPQEDVLINKTGSTGGFGAYAAFIPAKKIGIVLLANKSYPIEARVTAAYQILTRLDALQPWVK